MQPLSNIDMITALNEAKYLFSHSVYMDVDQRRAAVESLAEWGIFTAGQLAEIALWSRSTISSLQLKLPTKGGGKFNARSLDTLLQLRLNWFNKVPLNTTLLKAAVDDGNSHRIISRLTGIPLSTISRKINEHDTSSPDLQRSGDDE